mgnify:CR=1 FL=1
MKNNHIAKHMNTYNKSSVHTDRKKEGISSSEEIKDGVQEFIDSFYKHQEETLGDTWKEILEISKKHPIKPPLDFKVKVLKSRKNNTPIQLSFNWDDLDG